MRKDSAEMELHELRFKKKNPGTPLEVILKSRIIYAVEYITGLNVQQISFLPVCYPSLESSFWR
jgi:hypothetical protein